MGYMDASGAVALLIGGGGAGAVIAAGKVYRDQVAAAAHERRARWDAQVQQVIEDQAAALRAKAYALTPRRTSPMLRPAPAPRAVPQRVTVADLAPALPRCWWCGAEALQSYSDARLCSVDDGQAVVWPAHPVDHVHAAQPPSPSQLVDAGHEALQRVRSAATGV